jgi:hypothetical protein
MNPGQVELCEMPLQWRAGPFFHPKGWGIIHSLEIMTVIITR